MKLQDIDFGVGFRDRIMLGVKDTRKPNCFEGQPIDITERFERVMLDYLLAIKENDKTLCFCLENKKTKKIEMLGNIWELKDDMKHIIISH